MNSAWYLIGGIALCNWKFSGGVLKSCSSYNSISHSYISFHNAERKLVQRHKQKHAIYEITKSRGDGDSDNGGNTDSSDFIITFQRPLMGPFLHITGKLHSQVSAVKTDRKIPHSSMLHKKHTTAQNGGPTEMEVNGDARYQPTKPICPPMEINTPLSATLSKDFPRNSARDKQVPPTSVSHPIGHAVSKRRVKLSKDQKDQLRQFRRRWREENSTIQKYMQLQFKLRRAPDIFDLYATIDPQFTNAEISWLEDSGVMWWLSGSGEDDADTQEIAMEGVSPQ